MKIIYEEKRLKDIIMCVLIISTPLTRTDPAKLDEIKARFGVPPDAMERLNDKAIFKNTEYHWPVIADQLRLPL